MSGSCRHAQAVKRFLKKSLAPATDSIPKAPDSAHTSAPQGVAPPIQRERPKRAELRTLSGLLKELEAREEALLLETGTTPSPGTIRSTDKHRASALRQVLIYFGELPPEQRQTAPPVTS